MKTRRVWKKTWLALLLALCLLVPVVSQAAPKYPSVKGYANDYAGLLSSSAIQTIDSLGASMEKATTAQAVVAVIQTLDGVALEEYATGLFRDWGIGQEKGNNGVLLLVAVEERKARIEVGYGLEGAITDGKSGRILDEFFVPYMRENETDSAVLLTYNALLEAIAQEYGVEYNPQEGMLPDAHISYESEDEFSMSDMIIVGIIVALVLLDIIFNRGRIVRLLLIAGRRGGGGRGGGGGRSGGGGFSGGGGSSGGGGASRGW